MKNQKLTPGEQLYAASNNIDFWKWYIQEKENKARIKAEKKAYWDAKFFENKLKNPQPVENPIVIADNAPKYKHNRFGIGVLVSEDETTITLSFDGKIQKLNKKFSQLTLI